MTTTFENSITLPKGFRAAGVSAGIKKVTGKDMALFVSDTEAVAVGTFTTNQVKAAPVKVSQKHMAGKKGRAIVVNSGIANACTGEQGLSDAERMAALVANLIKCPREQVFVCSTGNIGSFLPMPAVENGIQALAAKLSVDGGVDAAEAIMTTDTTMKHCQIELAVDGKPVRLVGIAKGSGMIEPNMATMLAFVMTDAVADVDALQNCLREAVSNSFNRITVDGDMSTNDTVICLANGLAGNMPLKPGHKDWTKFHDALMWVTHELALKMVVDGEGATKQVTVHVQGAASAEEADIAARAVANSLLVKTSWAGQTAKWGRVIDALGYSKAKVIEDKIDIDYDELPAVRAGKATVTTQQELQWVVAKDKFTIHINLHIANGEAVVYTCNCTEEYVRINV